MSLQSTTSANRPADSYWPAAKTDYIAAAVATGSCRIHVSLSRTETPALAGSTRRLRDFPAR